jgi:diaminopimelate decarboxylase
LDHFVHQDGQLFCDGVAVAEIAEAYGTPAYIYSKAAIVDNFRALRDAFAEVDPLICYAIKANYNLAVCKTLLDEGCGFDIVSGGELFRALKIGADPKTICFAGVGKTRSEIEYALQSGILMFNVESAPELEHIDAVAAGLGVEAAVALRLNPDVDARTHKHTTTGKKESKFGIDFATAAELIGRADLKHTRIAGLHLHLGSPINTTEPYTQALERTLDFLASCRSRGAEIEWLDIGGGYGIEYKGGETAGPGDYADAVIPYLKQSGCRTILEPGRFIVANAAILTTRVQYVKETDAKTFVICDAGMNDLIRPALYDSYHRIWPVRSDKPVPHGEAALNATDNGCAVVDVVGPVCESGDCFAKGRPLPPVSRDDLLAIFSAGAYGYSMSSNYNSRPRGCEVMIEEGSPRIVRERESYDSLIAGEHF